MVLLVRFAEYAELTLTAVAEEVDQVQCALLAALCAVLDVVGDVEHTAQVRARAAVRDRFVEPVDDRHVVELPPSLRIEVPERGIARGREVLVQLLVDAVEIDGQLGVRVLAVVDKEEVLCALRLRLKQVVERESQLLCQLAHGRVTLIDQLAAMLGDLSIGEAY